MHVGKQLLQLNYGCVLLAALPVVAIDFLLFLQVGLEQLRLFVPLLFRLLLHLLAFLRPADGFLDLFSRLYGHRGHLLL